VLTDEGADEAITQIAMHCSRGIGPAIYAGLHLLRLREKNPEASFDQHLHDLAWILEGHRRAARERVRDQISGEHIHVSKLTGIEHRY
jgi:hypothetical protein